MRAGNQFWATRGMPSPNIDQDAVIVGGGFYGAAIAIYLAKRRGIKRIVRDKVRSDPARVAIPTKCQLPVSIGKIGKCDDNIRKG